MSTGKIIPPPTASHFELWMLTPNEGRSPATGKRFRAPKPQRLYGDATRAGQLPEKWPVSSFDPVAFVRRWGPGRYRVQWLDGTGGKVSSQTFILADPAPTPSAAATRSLRARGDDEGSGDRSTSNGQGIGPLELMQLLDARAEQERQRASAEAEARMQRDREFMVQMQAQTAQFLALAMKETKSGRGGDAGGFDPRMVQRELDIMRREQSLTLREGLSQIRGEVTGMLDQGGGDDEPPPKDLGEATERMGIELVQELTREAPELLQKALPAFWTFLTKNGYKPSEKMKKRVERSEEQRLAAARAARAADQLGGGEDEGEEEEEEEDAQPQ